MEDSSIFSYSINVDVFIVWGSNFLNWSNPSPSGCFIPGVKERKKSPGVIKICKIRKMKNYFFLEKVLDTWIIVGKNTQKKTADFWFSTYYHLSCNRTIQHQLYGWLTLYIFLGVVADVTYYRDGTNNMNAWKYIGIPIIYIFEM